MKRLLMMLLALTLMVPGAALAERLQFELMEHAVVDAEAPTGMPDALCEIEVEPVKMDPELAKQLLMPKATRREEASEGGFRDVMFGDGDGYGDYMMVEVDKGRVYYVSEFYQMRIQDVLGGDRDEMTDQLHYYPEDREVDGFPRADAQKQADALLRGLGISDFLSKPRVLTFDTKSYDVMLGDLSQADRQTLLPRVYLEPYDTAHDGYFFIYQIVYDDLPLLGQRNREKLGLFISKSGIEYLETTHLKRIVGRSEKKPVLGAKEALLGAVPGIKAANEKNEYTIGTVVSNIAPNMIERIRLGYMLLQSDSSQENETLLIPVWDYTYLRVMMQDKGTWKDRSFDNPAFLGDVIVHATSGEYLECWQR